MIRGRAGCTGSHPVDGAWGCRNEQCRRRMFCCKQCTTCPDALEALKKEQSNGVITSKKHKEASTVTPMLEHTFCRAVNYVFEKFCKKDADHKHEQWIFDLVDVLSRHSTNVLSSDHVVYVPKVILPGQMVVPMLAVTNKRTWHGGKLLTERYGPSHPSPLKS